MICVAGTSCNDDGISLIIKIFIEFLPFFIFAGLIFLLIGCIIEIYKIAYGKEWKERPLK